MKCYHCGTADTRVLDTRSKGGAKVRRHECGNGHRFKTIECHEQVQHNLARPLSEVLARIERGIVERRLQFVRGVNMARAALAGVPKAEIAKRYGVAYTTVVRQVRKHSAMLRDQVERSNKTD